MYSNQQNLGSSGNLGSTNLGGAAEDFYNAGKNTLSNIGSDTKDLGKETIAAIAAPIQAKILQKIDYLVIDIRNKIAKDRKISPSKVTDLEISEYLLQMPLGSTNLVVEKQAKSGVLIVSGSILIGFSLLALAVFFSRKK